MQKITPCLWFDKNCEEAVNFYTSIFPNSSIKHIERYPTDYQFGPVPDMGGKILTAIFSLNGLEFQALDGGPYFKKNPSISFMVNFDPSRDPEAAANLDKLWEKLSPGSTKRMELGEYPFSKRYGWIEDRFGMNWQLILTDPNGEPRPNIIPSLMFVDKVYEKGEEALNYYVSVFKNDSKMGLVAHYPPGSEPDTEKAIMFGEAMLAGQWFAAMDSAREHAFTFNEGISLTVECADQAEVDYFWDTFTKEGEESQCGWLKDKYGVSWQIVPKRMMELMMDPDRAKSKRAMMAMLTMKKLIVADLEKAANG